MDGNIYWTLHVMKKCWACIKKCVEDICMYILTVLSFTSKHIGKCGERRIAMSPKIFWRLSMQKVSTLELSLIKRKKAAGRKNSVAFFRKFY